jgi:hypothetical protein
MYSLVLILVPIVQQAWLEDLNAPDGDYPDVVLSEAYRFGVTKQASEVVKVLAWNHEGLMREKLVGWNTPSTLETWSAECQWRYRAWFLLDRALSPDPDWRYDEIIRGLTTKQSRLKALRELKEHIGAENYGAGMMPGPTPSYRMDP